MDPFARAAVCLQVFCERGLLQMEGTGDERSFARVPISGKADLEASPYLQTLRAILGRR